MTAQVGEILNYKGEEYSMCTEPLRQYFVMASVEPKFQWADTSNWRGYVGEWDIVGGRLYLVGIEGEYVDGSQATLDRIFPGFPDRVFAHWYTGTIRVPQGKILHYEHMGYESIFERDLLLDIEKGVLVDSRVRLNAETDIPGADE